MSHLWLKFSNPFKMKGKNLKSCKIVETSYILSLTTKFSRDVRDFSDLSNVSLAFRASFLYHIYIF